MELKKIYFDSFKSLINEELEISDNCIGIVGINESGKSNILQAIRVLKSSNSLNKKDSPKTNNSNPKLRFLFETNSQLKNSALELINNWLKSNTLIKENVKDLQFNIEYSIEYDIHRNIEKRDFKLINTNLKHYNFQILLPEFLSSEYKILINKEYISLEKAILINKETLDKSLKEESKLNDELFKLNYDLELLNNDLEDLNILLIEDAENKEIQRKKIKIDNEIQKKNERRDIILKIQHDFNPKKSIEEIESKISSLNSDNEKLNEQIASSSTIINPKESFSSSKSKTNAILKFFTRT